MAKKISQLPAADAPIDGTELMEVVQGGASKKLPLGNLPMKTPASATATGVQGTVVWDASYVYVCVATNTWKRAAIASW